MTALHELIKDFNEQWLTLKSWEPINENSGAMRLAFKKSLIEKGNDLISHNNDQLLCTSEYVKACERAYMLGCKKL